MTHADARGTDAPRGARRWRRRRASIVAAVAVIACLGVVGVALWATGGLDVGGDPTRAVAQRLEQPTTTQVTGDAPPSCRTPLTPDAPLRVWIAGDSLAGSLGPSLGEQLAATGVVQPVYDSRVSSGLSTPGFFDWPKHARSEIQRLDPEIVVFIIGANDWRAPVEATAAAPGTPAWRAHYERQVEEMLGVLEGPGVDGTPRHVYWLGSPPLQEKRMDTGVRQVDEVARAVSVDHPDVKYIDTYALFSGDDGHFAATLPGVDGRPVLVRAGDGVHFTPDGGDLLAEHAFRPLDARCDIDAQAVPGAAKHVIRTEGSTEVAGTSRTSASVPGVGAPAAPGGGTGSTPAAGRSNGGAGAPPTTAAAAPAPSTPATTTPTAPATTAPPATSPPSDPPTTSPTPPT